MVTESGLTGEMQNKEADNGNPEPARIVVIGAGISGLVAAFRLTRSGALQGRQAQVVLMERASRAGGAISTYELEDYLLELGPDMFQTEKKDALRLCEELGLKDYIVSTNDSCRRTFVAHDGRLHPLPDGFQMLAPTKLGPFFSSSLMTLSGKIRLAMDLFIPCKEGESDESLSDFVKRRFGQEALQRIAQPMLGGIYTADPDTLSLQATMPRFLEMERKYKSVIRGLMSEKKAQNKDANGDAGCRYSMFVSLIHGMGLLVERLLAALPPDSINFHCPVVSIEKGKHGKAWDVVVASGTIVPADAVVSCVPAYVSAELIREEDSDLSSLLKKIEYNSSAVMNLIYNRADIPHPLDGFGFVVPHSENRNILACSFSSVKFPGRCPPDKAVLRAFVGGALQKEIYQLNDEHIECLLWEDLRQYLGIMTTPLLSLITRYERAMPQYNVGHLDLVKSIREKLQGQKGLFLAGNAYDGVGIPDCVASGEKAAAQVAQLLKETAEVEASV